MTIVAGFPATDCVVLAADSEEGGGISKSSVHKIATVDKGNCKCLIGGAGHGDFIDLAVQQAEEQIPATADIKVIRQKLEAIVTDIYSNRIALYPEHQHDELSFDLLCAVWSKKDAVAKLVRVRRSACLVRKGPEVIGIGSYLARYLIATLGNETLGPFQAVRLAAHVIAQAKKYVSYCGGSTQVVGLGNDGAVVPIQPGLISQYEMTTTLFVEDVAKIIFYATDPIVTGFDPAKVTAAIQMGLAAWGNQLPVKFITMTGLPPELFAQAAKAAAQQQAAPAQNQPSNPTNSSSDQT